jgi:hypothetical protein
MAFTIIYGLFQPYLYQPNLIGEIDQILLVKMTKYL